jgi:hypothetical protein
MRHTVFSLTVFLTPIIGLRLRKLVGFEHPYVLVKPVFAAALLKFFYLGYHPVQNILMMDDA